MLGELATQFGEALRGNRGALRNMIGREDDEGQLACRSVPTPADYVNAVEAHDRGAVLVATIFDAFQRIYAFRTRDLLRIATNGTGVLPEGSISRDLVGRLASEAAEIAEHLLHICIRALDYSPPNDITFGSYLRALITADLDIAPEDENGYRVALIEAFRARGIFPSRVNTLSVESLLWQAPQFTKKRGEGARLHRARASERTSGCSSRPPTGARSPRSRARRRRSCTRWLIGKQNVLGAADWEQFLNKLGLTSLPVSELFGKRLARRHSSSRTEPTRVRPAHRSPHGAPGVSRPAAKDGRSSRLWSRSRSASTPTSAPATACGRWCSAAGARSSSVLAISIVSSTSSSRTSRATTVTRRRSLT